ncbi:MAG: outer membrane efflux protein [Bacteroidetes bacterium]|nr:MAG: outer membrane efflux protein [Bacteroidota bacterium]
MHHVRKWLAAVILLAGVKQAGAAGDTTAYAFSLKQSVDYAMQQQTSVKNAMLDEQIAKYKIWEIAGIGLPHLSASFDLKDFVEIPTSLIPGEFFGGPPGSFIPVKFGTQYNATAGISASQLLFDGTYIVGLQATKVYLDLAQKQSQRTKIEANVAVTKAYYTVLVNDERMTLLDANVEKIKKLRDDTKALYTNGFVEKLDYDRVEVAYNNLVTERDKVKRLLDLGLSLLKYQMGMEQSANLTLTDKLDDISFQPAVPMAEKFNYANRVEFGLVESQLKGYNLQLRKDRFSRMPSMALYGSVQAQAQRTKFDFLDGTSQPWYPIGIIGFQFNLPIFSGMTTNYRIQQDKILVQKAQNDLLMMQRVIDLDVSNARIQLQNASVSLDTQKKNIALAEEVYATSKKKLDAGVGSNMEVLNAQTALKEAQTNYFNALFEAVVAKVDYDKATGTIK